MSGPARSARAKYNGIHLKRSLPPTGFNIIRERGYVEYITFNFSRYQIRVISTDGKERITCVRIMLSYDAVSNKFRAET